jgi:hypothetical protein
MDGKTWHLAHRKKPATSGWKYAANRQSPIMNQREASLYDTAHEIAGQKRLTKQARRQKANSRDSRARNEVLHPGYLSSKQTLPNRASSGFNFISFSKNEQGPELPAPVAL